MNQEVEVRIQDTMLEIVLRDIEHDAVLDKFQIYAGLKDELITKLQELN